MAAEEVHVLGGQEMGGSGSFRRVTRRFWILSGCSCALLNLEPRDFGGTQQAS